MATKSHPFTNRIFFHGERLSISRICDFDTSVYSLWSHTGFNCSWTIWYFRTVHSHILEYRHEIFTLSFVNERTNIYHVCNRIYYTTCLGGKFSGNEIMVTPSTISRLSAQPAIALRSMWAMVILAYTSDLCIIMHYTHFTLYLPCLVQYLHSNGIMFKALMYLFCILRTNILYGWVYTLFYRCSDSPLKTCIFLLIFTSANVAWCDTDKHRAMDVSFHFTLTDMLLFVYHRSSIIISHHHANHKSGR